jgi:transmembrane sensor
MEQDEIESLVIRKLTNTLTDDEDRELQEHLKNDAELQNRYNHFEKIFLNSGKLRLSKGLSREARWKTLQQRMQQEQKPASTGNSRKRLWHYAAAIFLIMITVYRLWPDQSLEVEYIAKDTKKVIELPDLSRVTLNKGSRLSYDPDSFSKERNLKVEGEAFFQVKHNGTPFQVTASKATVKVLGTSFNIRSSDMFTVVTCLTGKVSVKDKKIKHNEVILTKGSAVAVNGREVPKPFLLDRSNEASWATGELSFDNTPLPEVFRDLEHHFNLKIQLNREVGSLAFTGKFNDPQFENVMETVCLSAGLTFSVSNDSSVVIK